MGGVVGVNLAVVPFLFGLYEVSDELTTFTKLLVLQEAFVRLLHEEQKNKSNSPQPREVESFEI